jgi:flagellar basal-body rod modification protein FlgD
MSTTTSTSSTSGTPASGGAATDVNGNALVNPSTQLDENSFLKLLVAQLQYQDPLSPTDSQAFVQEQAQFSQVEGLLNVQKSMTSLIATTQLSQDIDMIGKEVAFTNPDGSTAAGVVDGVITGSDGTVSLSVGGSSVDPSTVVGIAAGPSASSNSSNSTTSTQGTTAGG